MRSIPSSSQGVRNMVGATGWFWRPRDEGQVFWVSEAGVWWWWKWEGMLQSLYLPGVEIKYNYQVITCKKYSLWLDLTNLGTRNPLVDEVPRESGVRGAVHDGGLLGRFWIQTAKFKFSLATL